LPSLPRCENLVFSSRRKVGLRLVDVPSDKARFTFDVTTPRDVSAVANGSLSGRRRLPYDRQEFTYSTRDPIPTDVTQVAVGNFRAVHQRGPHGLPVRSYVPADQYAKLKPVVSRTPGQLAWLEKTLGLRYPFENYGVLALNSDYYGVALETASLSTYGARALGQPASRESEVVVHESTHQYFGDAVSVRTWDDMWLSEGHAIPPTSRAGSTAGPPRPCRGTRTGSPARPSDARAAPGRGACARPGSVVNRGGVTSRFGPVLGRAAACGPAGGAGTGSSG
jgi:hypothetical protein